MMMDFLVQHGPSAATVLFFVMFLGFAFWAFRPANKSRLEQYGHIPLEERQEGE